MNSLTLRGLVLFLVLWGLRAQDAPSSGVKPTVSELMKFKSLNAELLAPDAKSVMFMIQQADFKENRRPVNLWIADGMGGTRQLTSGTHVDDNPRWSPDAHWLAFRSDRDRKPESAGRRQVWLVPAAGGDAVQLSHEQFEVGTLEWSPDGKRIAVTATQVAGDRPETEQSCIFLVSIPDGRSEQLYASDRPVTDISFSPKGDEIAFADQPTWREPDGRFHSVVKVLSISSKQVRVLSGGDLSSSRPKFSPDAKWVAFQGGAQKNWIANHYLYIAPASGGTVRRISRDFDEDIGQFEWAENSSCLYFTGAHGMDVYLFRVSLDARVSPVYAQRGITRSISIAGGAMAFIHEAPNEPPNVYIATHSSSGAGVALEPRKVTDLNPYFRALALGEGRTIQWKSKHDGLLVEGQLLTPPDYQPGRKYPFLLVIHGGPNGQFSNGFVLSTDRYPLQVFAAQGYVILMPNPRGSVGYGQKFREMVLKDWGGADYEDIQSGVDELIARGIVDEDRMGVMGWSYGGYMTAWIITHSQRFRAASIGAAPVDLFSMYGGTDIPEFLESYFGGSPWTAHEFYFTHSPMAYLEHVKTPTLIQHGTEDRRVPSSISEELYRALQAAGVESDIARYPRSGHGLGEPKLIEDAFERNLEWFDRHLQSGKAQAAR